MASIGARAYNGGPFRLSNKELERCSRTTGTLHGKSKSNDINFTHPRKTYAKCYDKIQMVKFVLVYCISAIGTVCMATLIVQP